MPDDAPVTTARPCDAWCVISLFLTFADLVRDFRDAAKRLRRDWTPRPVPAIVDDVHLENDSISSQLPTKEVRGERKDPSML